MDLTDVSDARVEDIIKAVAEKIGEVKIFKFKCYKCDEKGHFARDYKAVKCPNCKEVLNKCEC